MVLLALNVHQVIEKRGEPEVALRRYDHACRISPENSLVRFNRARLLMALERYEVRTAVIAHAGLVRLRYLWSAWRAGWVPTRG
jgi:predicted Zn-dependent protease